MAMRSLALGLTVLFLSFSSLSWGQERCSDIFYSSLRIQQGEVRADAELSKDILKFMDVLGAGSTTSLRQESKFVVSEAVVSEQLRLLDLQYGSSFQLRDQRQEGRKNVTVTQYAFPFKIKSGKKDLSAKIRFRKYFDTSDQLPLGQDALQPAGFVKDRQFVEFKIDHPEFEQVVIKPRMIVLDSDVAMLHKKSEFEQHRAEILERTVALPANAKTPRAVIEQFMEVFGNFYSKGPETLPLFAQTIYVRDSYSVMLKNQTGEPVEIQMTIDREIGMTDTRSGKKTTAYRTEDIVVELKIPLAYAGLTAKNFADVPGLKDIARLKKSLKAAHIQLYAEGSGKLSTFRKTLENLE